MIRRIGALIRRLARLHPWLVALAVIGMFCLGLLAIANNWKGLSAIAFYLVSAIGLPAVIVAAFPQAVDHVRRITRAALVAIVMIALVFASTFLYALAQQPIYIIGVSLPFSREGSMTVALKMYMAMLDRFEEKGATFDDETQTRMTLGGKKFEIMPFDDSRVGDEDCTERDSCRVFAYDARVDSNLLNKEVLRSRLAANPDVEAMGSDVKKAFHVGRYFSGIVADPHVVGIIGPYNSGVALREIPAANRANVPLISPANTADCLTDPAFAAGDCDAEKLSEDSYFRVATRDSLRQKILADYLWEKWHDCTLDVPDPGRVCRKPPPGEPKVVIFSQSGPQATVFAKGASSSFIAAWVQHTGLKPTVYPVADASNDGDLETTRSPARVPSVGHHYLFWHRGSRRPAL